MPTNPGAGEAGFHIRPTTVEDVPLILDFICSIAEYEKLLDKVSATEEILRESLFGERPAAEVVFAEYDGQPAAFAVFFTTFSTFVGRPGLWLDDLFVKPEFRGKGIGKKMMQYLARLACDRNYGRFEWMALNWNESAVQFYEQLGAERLDEWRTFRLSGANLKQVADKELA